MDLSILSLLAQATLVAKAVLVVLLFDERIQLGLDVP